MDDRYNPTEIEKRWRERWDADRLYRTPDDDPRPKWYALTMYPYTSGDLHIGHWYAMAPSDVQARYKRMRGYNVLFPMGFDSFGLPAENAAIKYKIHPYRWTMDNVEHMRRQLKTMGAIFDWEREVITSDPDYYRWTQWWFLQLYKNDLAYRGLAPANWCPSCQTVLANEQVLPDGTCERCHTPVTRRNLEQWFFRITKYADELLIVRRDRVAGAHRHYAAQLDRPQRGDDDRLRARHPRRGGEGDPRLHHAAGHRLRRDLHGDSAGAPAGAEADDAGAAAGGGGSTSRGAGGPPRSSASPRSGRRRASSPAPTASTCSTARRCRYWSPTTCSSPTAPASSWGCRRTTSATSSSPRSTAYRSASSSRPPATRASR